MRTMLILLVAGTGFSSPSSGMLPAVSGVVGQVGTCDGVQVEMVCCDERGEYRFTTQCIFLAGWSSFWSNCVAVLPVPMCPPGQEAYLFVTNPNCSKCDSTEGGWVHPANLNKPMSPNCHYRCTQLCWDATCYFWACSPWNVRCDQWTQ